MLLSKVKAALLAVQRVREIAVPINRTDDAQFRDVLEKCASTAMNSKLIAHYKCVPPPPHGRRDPTWSCAPRP